MKPLSLAHLAVSLILGASGTLALPAPAAYAQNGVIRCESQNNRERICNTGWRDAQLIRQLSGSPCEEGRSWGSRNGSIWVSNGCRAEFAESRGGWGGGNGGGWGGNDGRPGQTIRCESQNNRERSCPVGWRNARLVRQLSGSPCQEGRTWGVRGGAIWVSNGCRAEFTEARGWGGGGGGGGGNSNYSVTCSSNNNRTQNCDWNPRQGRPVLQQQLSGSACQEGRSWGYSRGQLWVSNGCRARFGTR